MKLLALVALMAVFFLVLIAEGDTMNNISVKLNFSQMPVESTCLGKNISPRIDLAGLNTMALALILEDIDAPRGTFTHWIMWNIDPVNTIPEGIPTTANLTKPIAAVQGVNSAGKMGYFGPCPPPGKPHRYVFRVYGLDGNLNLRAGSNRSQLEAAMKGHIVQQGEAMATFGR